MSAKRYICAALTYKDVVNDLESVITKVTTQADKSALFVGVIKRANANVGTFSLPISWLNTSNMTLDIPIVSTAVKDDFSRRWALYASVLSGGIMPPQTW